MRKPCPVCCPAGVEVGEQIQPAWTPPSETICPLSGDGVCVHLFGVILILRKETMVFSRHQGR